LGYAELESRTMRTAMQTRKQIKKKTEIDMGNVNDKISSSRNLNGSRRAMVDWGAHGVIRTLPTSTNAPV
jgi:hypothetical protein